MTLHGPEHSFIQLDLDSIYSKNQLDESMWMPGPLACGVMGARVIPLGYYNYNWENLMKTEIKQLKIRIHDVSEDKGVQSFPQFIFNDGNYSIN